jgi:hypothetical protein
MVWIFLGIFGSFKSVSSIFLKVITNQVVLNLTNAVLPNTTFWEAFLNHKMVSCLPKKSIG